MTKVTNTAEGPRGVETDAGTVFIESGETVDVEVKKGHALYEGLKAGKVKEESPEPKPLAKMNKTELLDTAKAENVAVADDATNAQIAEAIEKARAAT